MAGRLKAPRLSTPSTWTWISPSTSEPVLATWTSTGNQAPSLTMPSKPGRTESLTESAAWAGPAAGNHQRSVARSRSGRRRATAELREEASSSITSLQVRDGEIHPSAYCNWHTRADACRRPTDLAGPGRARCVVVEETPWIVRPGEHARGPGESVPHPRPRHRLRPGILPPGRLADRRAGRGRLGPAAAHEDERLRSARRAARPGLHARRGGPARRPGERGGDDLRARVHPDGAPAGRRDQRDQAARHSRLRQLRGVGPAQLRARPPDQPRAGRRAGRRGEPLARGPRRAARLRGEGRRREL